MNTTRDIPYISQERGYAVFRRRIPTRLRSAFGGQQEIFASLRHAPLETMTEGSTRRRAGYRKAVKRAAALLGAEVEKALSRAESGEFVGRMESRRCEEILAHALTREDAPAVVEPSLPPPPPPLLESDIEPLARRYQSLHLLTDHTMRFGDDDSTVPMLLEEHRAYKDLIEETVEQLSEAQACGDTGIVREVAQEFLASEGFAAQVADNVYRKFEQRLLAADLETAQLQLLRAQGQSVATPDLPEIDDEALLLSSLLVPWAQLHVNLDGNETKTVTEAKAGIRYFEQWSIATYGRVRAVNQLKVEDAAAFRDWLLKVVPKRNQKTGKPMDPDSVTKYLGLLSGIVSRHMADRTVSFTNVFFDVKKPKKPRGCGKPRIAFTEEQLVHIYTHPRMTAHRQSSDRMKQTVFWFYVLGLFTGARPEELAQMLVRDIKCFDNTMYLSLTNEAEGQTIKTIDGSGSGSGSRLVPFHQELLALGFDDYVTNQRRRLGSEGRLFDALKPSKKYGSLTSVISKHLNRLLRKIGISDKRLVFYSLRHTFKHFGRMCGIPKAIVDQLAGHETGEVGDAYGGENFPVEPLIEGMQMYRLPFLDLSHLYPNASGVAK